MSFHKWDDAERDSSSYTEQFVEKIESLTDVIMISVKTKNKLDVDEITFKLNKLGFQKKTGWKLMKDGSSYKYYIAYADGFGRKLHVYLDPKNTNQPPYLLHLFQPDFIYLSLIRTLEQDEDLHDIKLHYLELSIDITPKKPWSPYFVKTLLGSTLWLRNQKNMFVPPKFIKDKLTKKKSIVGTMYWANPRKSTVAGRLYVKNRTKVRLELCLRRHKRSWQQKGIDFPSSENSLKLDFSDYWEGRVFDSSALSKKLFKIWIGSKKKVHTGARVNWNALALQQIKSCLSIELPRYKGFRLRTNKELEFFAKKKFEDISTRDVFHKLDMDFLKPYTFM